MIHSYNKLIVGITGFLALSAAAVAQTPPAWSATTAYKVGNIVSYEGINFQCIVNETTNRPNPHIPAAWDISFVYSGNVTIPVGPTAACTSLTSAWNYIKLARLAVGATITIALQPNYNENFNSSFSLDHPFGAQIFIVGSPPPSPTVPSPTTPNVGFNNPHTGFVLDTGHVLGGLQGMVIGSSSGSSGGTPAIEVKQKAVLASVSNLYIQEFDIGLETDSGEIDNASGNITCVYFVTGGLLASGHGAVINCTGAVTIDGSPFNTTTPLYAFQATNGGSINCQGCVGNNCQQNFMATSTGVLYCNGSSSTDTSSASPYYSCYFAAGHGTIIGEATAAKGSEVGYQCDRSSYMDLYLSQASGYSSVGYDATHMSQIDAGGSTGGSTNHDATSNVITG